MSAEEKNQLELKKEILIGFHTQFAENQRIREQSFLKILGFLGAVIVGYSYVFHKTDEFNAIEFSFIAIISEILILFGSLVVLSIAYNFRRDQTINAKIREYAKVLGEDNIFPISYDPRMSESCNHWFYWLPNFLANFFYVFPIVLIILVISYIVKLDLKMTFANIDWLITSTVIVGIFSLIIILYAYYAYFQKLLNFIKDNTQKTTKEST